MWRQYVPLKRRNININHIKTIVIAILAIAVVLLLGVIVNLKRANNLRQYAINNNCEWSWQGTAYGDSRDYICK